MTRNAHWRPLAAFIAASVLAASLPAASVEASYLKGFELASGIANPTPRDDGTIATGREIYGARCALCHGVAGRGDGPAGVGLHPPPADLFLHVPQHTDGELYFFIARGIPGTQMREWRTELSEDERWSLVHYLRELGDGRR